VAENLWKIRQKKGMTVSQLAAKSGVPARLINEYEAGQRAIRSMDLAKIAQALYVDEADIKLLSDPIPPSAVEPPSRPMSPSPRPAPPSTRPSAPPAAPKPAPRPEPPPKPAEPPKAPPPPQPARPSQIAHLEALAKRLGMDQTQLEALAGKPIAQLLRQEASKLLGELQRRIREEKPPRAKDEVERHRPYLPESVDEFELNYLTQAKEAQARFTFTLFDGRTISGTIIGFSPYAITVREDSGDEVTLQKLAIAFYRKSAEKPAAGEGR